MLAASVVDIGDTKKQIVLKIGGYIDFDARELNKEAWKALNANDIDRFLSILKEILKFKHPYQYVFANLGKAYLMKKDKKTAIDYYVVANALGPKDYSKYIEILKYPCSRGERKPYFEMSEKDFSDDYDKNIIQVEKVIELMISGLSFNEACQALDLDEENKNYIALIFAKRYFTVELYEIGNRYLMMVEKAKNKSKKIQKLLQETKKDQRFYKNRITEEERISLTRKMPNKKI